MNRKQVRNAITDDGLILLLGESQHRNKYQLFQIPANDS
jgi:hypothetical protein